MVLATVGLVALFSACSSAGETWSGEVSERAERLIDRLQGPGPVRIMAFGDSITAGWGVADPERNTYHQLFAAALRARYHDCRIDVITAGGPGDESAVGLLRIESEVIPKDPDLVIIQFTGNDSRLERGPEVLQSNIELLTQRVLDRTDALPMLVANPMNDPVPGNPYVAAVLQAGRETGAPAADFDEALFGTHRDFRGPFAYEAHPMDFSHVACAKKLLETFDEITGTERLFDVSIEQLNELVPTGGQVRLRACVRSLVDRPLDVVLDFGGFELPSRQALRLEPGGSGCAKMDVPVPPLATAQRSVATELLAIGRCGRFSSFDAKWLTFAPVLHPDRARSPLDESKLHWYPLTHDCLVLGEAFWGGDWDLSGRFALVETDDRLTVMVDVTDDHMTVAPVEEHMSFGDSIEVYLDLRRMQEQGLPVYGRDVIGILGAPGSEEVPGPRWQPLDSLVPLLAGTTFSCHANAGGYRASISIPLDSLRAWLGDDWDGIGFDIGLNDADFGVGRSTQMFFCGHADNYLDPSRLAGLARKTPNRRLWRVTLR